MIKAQQSGCRGNVPQYIKVIHYKPAVNIILPTVKNCNPLRSGTKQGIPVSALLFNIVLEVLPRAVWQEIKGIHTGKEEGIPSLFTHDRYIWNSKDFTKHLLN